MVQGVLTLLALQLFGEVLARAFRLPVPGPVIGLLLLVMVLSWRGHAPDWLAGAADGLLRHLSLLFVPAAAGVVLHLDRLRGEAFALGTALVLSTLFGLLAAAWTTRRLIGRDPAQEPTP
jgi:holin-like protein